MAHTEPSGVPHHGRPRALLVEGGIGLAVAVKASTTTLPTVKDIEALDRVMGRALNDVELFVMRLRNAEEMLREHEDEGNPADLAEAAPTYEQIGRIWSCLEGIREYDVANLAAHLAEGVKLVGEFRSYRGEVDFELAKVRS